MNMEQWITVFLQKYARTGEVYNDATKQGVAIVPGASGVGYRVRGIHRLTSQENMGKHSIFVEVRPRGGELLASDRSGHTSTAKFDKPSNEPATNIPLWGGQEVSVMVHHPGFVSDVVTGLSSSWGDIEPPGVTWGHVSYFIYYERVDDRTLPPPSGGEFKLSETEKALLAELRRDRAYFGREFVELLLKLADKAGV